MSFIKQHENTETKKSSETDEMSYARCTDTWYWASAEYNELWRYDKSSSIK